MKIVTIIINLCISLVSISTTVIVNADDKIAHNIGGEILNNKTVGDSIDNSRYNVYEFVNGGYLIYDNLNQAVLEYSLENVSPYRDMEGQLFYFGPTQYFHRVNDKFKDVFGRDVSLDNMKNISLLPKEMISSNKRNITCGEVLNAFYFKKLDGTKNTFPENIDGECGYVAASILLSYYACFKNPDLISSKYISPVNNTSYNVSEWENIPCANQEFMELLETDIYPDSSIALTIDSSISWYLNLHTNITNFEHFYDTSLVTPLYSTIINKLDDGIPVILFGNFKYTSNSSGNELTTKGHSVLAYGYDNSNGNMLLTHFGWEGYNEVWINYNFWQNGPSYTLEIDEHKHSDLFKVNNHEFCVTDQVHISSYVKSYEYESTTTHKIVCNCGYFIDYEGHDFVLMKNVKSDLEYLPLKKYICSSCGYITSIIGEVQ